MTVYKITVSLTSRAAEHVKRAVRHGRTPSASAYITAAIEEKANAGDLDDMLDDMLDRTGGPMTPAEIRETERKLGITNPRTKPRVAEPKPKPKSRRVPR